jgi:hypothetical protein
VTPRDEIGCSARHHQRRRLRGAKQVAERRGSGQPKLRRRYRRSHALRALHLHPVLAPGERRRVNTRPSRGLHAHQLRCLAQPLDAPDDALTLRRHGALHTPRHASVWQAPVQQHRDDGWGHRPRHVLRTRRQRGVSAARESRPHDEPSHAQHDAKRGDARDARRNEMARK